MTSATLVSLHHCQLVSAQAHADRSVAGRMHRPAAKRYSISSARFDLSQIKRRGRSKQFLTTPYNVEFG